jgi:GrpB-like predicted nucleotidyltransferase (UPF0157 family)
MKNLDEMSTAELGMLFPIEIVKPNATWKKLFEAEKLRIESILNKENISRIEHIGNTAVPNLPAKPIIDILLEINEKESIKEEIISRMQSLAYHYIPRPENPPPHIMLVKGYTPEGFKGQTYHVHVRYKGIWDEIYFRDYLIKHKNIAEEYASLKYEMALKYKNDRDGYTEAKTAFITKINRMAKE